MGKLKIKFKKVLNKMYEKSLEDLLICNCFRCKEKLTEEDIKELLQEIEKEWEKPKAIEKLHFFHFLYGRFEKSSL